MFDQSGDHHPTGFCRGDWAGATVARSPRGIRKPAFHGPILWHLLPWPPRACQLHPSSVLWRLVGARLAGVGVGHLPAAGGRLVPGRSRRHLGAGWLRVAWSGTRNGVCGPSPTPGTDVGEDPPVHGRPCPSEHLAATPVGPDIRHARTRPGHHGIFFCAFATVNTSGSGAVDSRHRAWQAWQPAQSGGSAAVLCVAVQLNLIGQGNSGPESSRVQ